MEKTLLLVDDEPNILTSLTRLFRRDGYRILTAQSGAEGLDILQRESVCVIVSDQRMSGMIGSEFLAQAKLIHPETVRIILSGYTELKSVTEAINRGAVYKFLTKPWEDDLLREQIREAFRVYFLDWDNRRLSEELQIANEELSRINRELEDRVNEKSRQVVVNMGSLNIAEEVLDYLPIGVISVDTDGMIAAVNECALVLLGGHPVLGMRAEEVLPPALVACIQQTGTHHLTLHGHRVSVKSQSLGHLSPAQGFVVSMIPEQLTCTQ